ncbi:MAG: GNAT family N-acetyltransferase [SAR324 cluster bacterium]|nr:GNAT family N-acetyltransferase [SAR324 cluster bacterium]
MAKSTDWHEKYAGKIVTAKKAVADVKRGQRVFIGSGAAEPQLLVEALSERGKDLADNQVIHIRSLGVAAYTESKFSDKFRYNTFFIGDNVRDAVSQGRADYTPIFLSEVPRLMYQGKATMDVALIQVTPPDEHGFCSYGVSVDIVKAATETAKIVVAEINPQMPRTLGNSFIHVDQIDRIVENDTPILEMPPTPVDEIAQRIGQHIANLVEDGSTIQMGIGTIPDSVLTELRHHKDLGVHTEMLSDGILDLIEGGVVTGACKTIHKHKVVASFAIGTKRLYDFIDDNPMFEFYPNEYSNDPFLIGQNVKMVAINSALEIDLTGQVCADSVGSYFYSGIGGQVDFIRGASRSAGGKPIIALPSTYSVDGKMVSRIVPMLNQGAGVVTSRGDVHYVVTEYGSADLHGKTIRERALALIHIAHPDFREELMKAAKEQHYVYSDQLVSPEIGLPEVEKLKTTMTAKEGIKVHFRPVKPTDEGMLQELFYRSSIETIYLRFFTYLKALPHSKAQQMAHVDYDKNLALVGSIIEEGHEAIIAVGFYDVDPKTKFADSAFMVRDDWQDKGVGKYLMSRLIDIAHERGIKGFTADILARNTRMRHVFDECAPAPIQSTMEEGYYHLTFPLEKEPLMGSTPC